jgi:subtilase family serine protease
MIQMKDNVKEKNRKDLRNISETGMMEEHSPLKVIFSIVVVSLMVLGAFAVVINTGAQGNTASPNVHGNIVKNAALYQAALSSPDYMISGTLPYMPPGAVKLSTINLNMTTNIFMGMKLQHNTFLNAYLAQVSNPASPIYRHYLTHSQFVDSFEVNSTVYDQIASYYSSMGLTVVKENDRGYMEVSGSLLNLQKAFNTTFAMFSTNLGDFYFNLQNISVPSVFSSYINTAIGFNNFPYFTPGLTLNPALGTNISNEFSQLMNAPNSGTGALNPQPPYTPQALQIAYNETKLISSGVNGNYITIAVTDAFGDPTSLSDLTQYDTLYNMPTTNSYQTIYPYGTPSPVSTAYGSVVDLWEVESALDFQMAHATSPNANLVSVISPDADYTLTQSLVFTITNQLANVISNSWGAPEPEIGNEAQYFHPFAKEAAATGITVMAASGDQGSAGYDSSVPRSVMWPSNDPYVLGVGGTTIFMNGTLNTGVQSALNGPPGVNETFNPTNMSNETAWDGYTGGGYSILYSKPSWQTGQGIPTSGKYAYRRGIPDVSANAMFAGNLFVFNGVTAGSYAFGGTSFASPQWAGVIATADSYELDYGNGNMLGYLNPTFYAIFNSPVYHKAFYDVIYGYNGPNGLFDAGPGWSPVTGLGSPNTGFLTKELSLMTYSAGIKGDYNTTHASGISARIQTILPGSMYGTASAFINMTLSDGTQIMLGYVSSMSNPEGSWFYAIIPATSVFGSEGYITGSPGSAGTNGTFNTYSIVRTAPDTWSMEINGKTVDTFSSDANSTGNNLPYIGISIYGDYTPLNSFGPVAIGDLQYDKNGVFMNMPSVKSFESSIPLTGISPPYTFTNPIGVLYSGTTGEIEVGTGIPFSNGVTLFGTFYNVPPSSVLRNEPAYVSLYAQHVDSQATGGASSFQMTTEFPANQGNFNSSYLVPVLGTSAWSFHSSLPLATSLYLSQADPLYANFYLSLSSPLSGSLPGAVPVTVSIMVLDNGILIGENSTTHNLSLTHSVQDYNVSMHSLLSKLRKGSIITMIVSWYTASEGGTNVGYSISPQTGSYYPISLTLPSLNPVSITPPKVFMENSNYYVSSDVQSPFGSYDLKQVSGFLGTESIGYTVSKNSNYTFVINDLQVPYGTDHFNITGMDLQGRANKAMSTIVETTHNYKTIFTESGLPAGSRWYVNITGVSGNTFSLNSTGDQFAIYLIPGTYEYTFATTDKLFAPDITSSTFTVTSSAQGISLFFNPVTFTAMFHESGLPSGTSWYANLTGMQEVSQGSTINYELQNGTYGFTIASTDSSYEPNITNGFINVNGKSITVNIEFTQIYFTAKFTESGLPSGEAWYVNLSNGDHGSSVSPGSISFTLQDGVYSYTVSTSDSSYVPSTSSGSIDVSNSNINEHITFYSKSNSGTATFQENSLPYGTPWQVHLSNGKTYTTTGRSISAILEFGKYTYSIVTPDGNYHGTGGNFSMASGAQNISINFHPVLYTLVLSENGLLQGTVWHVIINGIEYNSSTQHIYVNLMNGTYIVNVVGESGYSRAVKTVTISVHGTDAQSSVTFISANGTQTHSSPVTTAIFATGGTAGTASSTYVVARKLGKRIIHGLKHLFKL